MAPPSRKRANRFDDDDEDLGVPAALGVTDAGLPGSKKKRPPPPPEERELDLEKLIFGDSQLLSTPATSKSKTAFGSHSTAAGAEDEEGRQEAVADDQLFMLDTGADEEDEDQDQSGNGSEEGSGEDDEDDEVDYEAAGSSADEDGERILIDQPGSSAEAGPSRTKKPRKVAVWTDPDDATLTIALTGRDAVAADGSKRGTKKLRRLREEAGETSVSGLEYELRLRKQFEKLHPRPIWASLRLFTSQQQNEDHDDAGERGDEPSFTVTDESSRTLSDLLRSDTGLLGTYSDANGKSIKAHGKLRAGEIEVDRLRDANSAQTSFATANDEAASAIEMLQFHPSDRASVLMTASRDRRVRLFQIDGNTNPLVQTLHVPDMPIQNASFHPSGSSVLISGTRPYLYAYDLQAGRVIRSSPWRGSGGVMSSSGDDGIERDLSMARFQPGTADKGNRLLAIGGRNGNVHLLDWGRSGASGGSRVGGFRMNSPLAGLCWDPTSQYDRGIDVRRGGKDHELLTLSTEGSVHVWDIRNTGAEVACLSIWRDQGLYGAKGIEVSPTGKFWSVGSDNGIVNIYKRPSRVDASDDSTFDGAASTPGGLIQPLKDIGNLTTASTTLRWNHDGQILALASRNKKDVLKLVHFPTMKVFSNWPTSGTPLGHVTAVDFSRGSQYMAIGNGRGKVLLYSLRHYI